MASPPADPAPAPVLPSWPLHCLVLTQRLAEEHGRYIWAVSKATADRVGRAEPHAGLGLMTELTQAWFDLVLSPFAAVADAFAVEVERRPAQKD